MKIIDILHRRAGKSRLYREQGLLLDCWCQWRYYNEQGDLYHAGGLSTLEDLEDYLKDHGLIDYRGKVVEKAKG